LHDDGHMPTPSAEACILSASSRKRSIDLLILITFMLYLPRYKRSYEWILTMNTPNFGV